MKAPNENGSLHLTGVHQEPPASFVNVVFVQDKPNERQNWISKKRDEFYQGLHLKPHNLLNNLRFSPQ